MLPVEEILYRLEAAARDDGHRVFVSGATRIDVEFIEELDKTFYRVNGTGAARKTVLQAIEAARMRQALPV